MRKMLLDIVAARGLRFKAIELEHWDGASVSTDRKPHSVSIAIASIA